MPREQLGTRLGFLLMTAGCAIGLGNVWRFPYITGRCGGALFVLFYLVFLAVLGFPLMVAELSLGRAGQSDLPGAVKNLRNKGRFWYIFACIFFMGNFLLLMYYSVVTGWMLSYAWKFATGTLSTKSADPALYFGKHLASTGEMTLFTFIGLFLTAAICMMGLKKGVEKTMKIMLGGMFFLQFVLIVMILRFEGAWEGVRFFLAPDWEKFRSAGVWSTVHAAMMKAFFTLSLGVGAIAVCGSYIDKKRALSGEAAHIILLDLAAALASGLIVFPACFAFDVSADQGPSLVFITLPKVFQQMAGGRILGTIFFVFLSVAALSTLITVGENIIAFFMRVFSLSRIKASLLFFLTLAPASLPCVFGFNLWKAFEPLGKGSNILDLEDFLVSDNLLPLGSVFILLFCTSSRGWGEENFLREANAGTGMKFPSFMNGYVKWVLPFGILAFWAHNLITKFL
ncbi:MAG: sodium-dependent transporter [Lentisphaeria bacterium]|nr:sodium-dependent transporter [Lentisphaeria bacterium]